MSAAALPDFLEPVLDYLSDVLPYPIYSFLINLMSHCLAFMTALFTLLSSLISTHPNNWDAQALLPPLITVLAAYLSLVAFYRTTSWVFRTTIWFIKWGTIFGVLAAGAGWFAGQQVNDVGGYSTALTKIGGVVLDIVNQRTTDTDTQTNSRSSRSRKTTSQKRPGSRYFFQRHREWKQQQERGEQGTDVRKLMNNIVDAATNVVKESSWQSLLGSVSGSVSGAWQANVQSDQSTKEPKAGSSRSR